jgi:hypothetical protein
MKISFSKLFFNEPFNATVVNSTFLQLFISLLISVLFGLTIVLKISIVFTVIVIFLIIIRAIIIKLQLKHFIILKATIIDAQYPKINDTLEKYKVIHFIKRIFYSDKVLLNVSFSQTTNQSKIVKVSKFKYEKKYRFNDTVDVLVRQNKVYILNELI